MFEIADRDWQSEPDRVRNGFEIVDVLCEEVIQEGE